MCKLVAPSLVRMPSLFTVAVFATATWFAHGEMQKIPTWKHQAKIWMGEFIVLTQNYSTPAIMTKYVNVSAFSKVCSCNGTEGMFDDLEVVHLPGMNSQFAASARIFPPMTRNGTEYWEEHVCKKEQSYVVYDENLWKSIYPTLPYTMMDWFKGIEKIIKVQPKIQDKNFEQTWDQQLFMGYAVRGLASTTKSGFHLHQVDRQTYYVQVCGSKRWIIGSGNIRFNDERDLAYHNQYMDGERFQGFIKRDDVYIGWTHPGDMMLIPVWVWHMAQTSAGTNVGISYRMKGEVIRSIAPPHLQPRAPRHELPYSAIQYWLAYFRGAIADSSVLQLLVPLVIVVIPLGIFRPGLAKQGKNTS